MTSIRDFLSGKKTYLVALAVIVIGVLEGPLEIDLPGVDVGEDWLGWILAGLGLTTLRRGVQKSEP